MFDWIARQILRRGWLVMLGWLILGVVGAKYAPRFDAVSQDDNVRFFPAGYPTVLGQDLLERGFPGNASSSTFVIVAERPESKLTADDLLYLDAVADTMKRLQADDASLAIKAVTDRRTPIIGSRMLGTSAQGGEAALVNVALTSTFASKQSRVTVDRFEEVLAGMPEPPRGLNLAHTGSAAVGHDMNSSSNKSIATTTYATVALVVLILLLIYRSPLMTLIPLTTIGLSAFIGMKAIATMSLVPWINFQVINVTKVFVIVVLFGAGTDYCLFLISRYREELARGHDRAEALAHAIRQVGGALVASAGTVIVGLGMLYFSSFAKIQFTGPAIALSLTIALLASLTIAPVLLNWLGGAVFWPFRAPSPESAAVAAHDPNHVAASPFWTSVADVVVKRPATILILSLAALTPLAVVGAWSKANYNQLADLHPEHASVIGARIIRQYFAVGELGPSWVLVHHPTIDFRSDEGLKAVELLARQLVQIDNVAEVRAVSRPLGKPLGTVDVGSTAKPAEPPTADSSFLGGLARFRRNAQRDLGTMALRSGADPRYVSTQPADAADRNHITRLEVVFRSDPFSAESLATLGEVRGTVGHAVEPGQPLAGASIVGLAGSSAEVNDLKVATMIDQRRMYWLVTAGVYAILVLLLRRPGISLYLIGTVVLGYLASLGLTDLVFRYAHTGPEPFGGLDWKVGFFLFVILVAVGEDYNILLMARVIEEEHRHGPIEGTRRAVAHTGGIISSCGIIMAGTFLSMLTGTLSSFRQMGFALGAGVLLDTFIVRPILVPAFIVLWHRTFPGARLESPVADILGENDDEPVASVNGTGPGAKPVPHRTIT
jgi:RND superfamily putative drug exporter